jgi:hypothetical protein
MSNYHPIKINYATNNMQLILLWEKPKTKAIYLKKSTMGKKQLCSLC